MNLENGAVRWLFFRGSNNTRDLGGYFSRDGRCIQTNRILRSGALTRITPASTRVLRERYQVRTIVDLRTTGERQRHPLPHFKGIHTEHIPVLEKAMLGITADDASTAKKMRGIMNAGMSEREFMVRVYTKIISDPHAIAAYRRLFQLLLAQKEGATLFFCSHGRDRTGIATLLILSALNVPMETIRSDYLVMPKQEVTQQKLIALLERLHCINHAQAEFARAFASPSEARFDSAIKWFQLYYGTVEEYLEKEILLSRADQERLQSMYLTEAIQPWNPNSECQTGAFMKLRDGEE